MLGLKRRNYLMYVQQAAVTNAVTLFMVAQLFINLQEMQWPSPKILLDFTKELELSVSGMPILSLLSNCFNGSMNKKTFLFISIFFTMETHLKSCFLKLLQQTILPPAYGNRSYHSLFIDVTIHHLLWFSDTTWSPVSPTHQSTVSDLRDSSEGIQLSERLHREMNSTHM